MKSAENKNFSNSFKSSLNYALTHICLQEKKVILYHNFRLIKVGWVRINLCTKRGERKKTRDRKKRYVNNEAKTLFYHDWVAVTFKLSPVFLH